MDARICTRAKGGKGVDSVFSLVAKFLNDEGWLKEEEQWKELHITANDCPGKNENDTAI